MLKLLRKAYWIYFYSCFAVVYLFFYPFFFITMGKKKYYPYAQRARQAGCRIILFLTFIKREVTGLENIPSTGSYILCGNHTSELDIPLILSSVPGNYSFLGKSELKDIPLVGKFFTTLDVPVYRNNSNKTSETYRRSYAKLKDGVSLVIFPEGGVYGNPEKVNLFKPGAFEMAIRCGVPVVPVALPDSHKRIGSDNKHGSPGKARIIILEPIPVSGMEKKDVSLLSSQVREKIRKLVE